MLTMSRSLVVSWPSLGPTWTFRLLMPANFLVDVADVLHGHCNIDMLLTFGGLHEGQSNLIQGQGTPRFLLLAIRVIIHEARSIMSKLNGIEYLLNG